MAITIPSFVHHSKFGFYFRKAFFQAFLPILLAFMSFCDFVNQIGKENNGYSYNHLYFYTSFILFCYALAKYLLDYIFSVCADDIIFKKEINLAQTTPDLLLSLNLGDQSNDNFLIVIKKIFKIRFSNSIFFQYIIKSCDFLGIDCPILIPLEVVLRLTNQHGYNLDNEDILLQTTLSNLYSYHPKKYDVVPRMDDDNMDQESLLIENLVPKFIVSTLDKTISDIQKELFNRPNNIPAVNV